MEELILKKISNNIQYIGNDLREFSGTNDGMYFNNRYQAVKLSNIYNWSQSFFTGMAFWAYVATKDEKYIKWNNSFYDEYYHKVFKTPLETMHDLGFLYSPYAVAMYKVTGDENMKKIGIKAADELAKRFNPFGKFIKAWGRLDGIVPDYINKNLAEDCFFTQCQGLAIVDSMMNLPLLFWAAEVTHNPFYRNIATAHCDTIKKYFLREDYSFCHAYRFNEQTGEALQEENYCGYGRNSYWARGAAWAIYGFAISYSYTKRINYLDISVDAAEAFADQCHGKMPIWDFKLPNSEPKTIDTSAGVIALCGCYEIIKHRKTKKILDFIDMMEKLIPKFINTDSKVNGILMQQNGKNIYSSIGDYFVVEAILGKKLSSLRIW